MRHNEQDNHVGSGKVSPGRPLNVPQHAKADKFSVSKNARALQEVDVAELERYYGSLKNSNDNGNGQAGEQNGHPETAEIDPNGQVETPVDQSKIVELLREQLADTKAELADAKARETKLLSMLETEQEKTRLLMLAPPQGEKKRQKQSIRDYFRLT